MKSHRKIAQQEIKNHFRVVPAHDADDEVEFRYSYERIREMRLKYQNSRDKNI